MLIPREPSLLRQCPVLGSMLSRAMRKIGSKRAWNWALATILWVSSWQSGLYAQQPATLSPKLIAVLNQREK